MQERTSSVVGAPVMLAVIAFLLGAPAGASVDRHAAIQSSPDTESGGGGGGGGLIHRATDPIGGVAGAVAGAAKDVLGRATGPLGAEDEPFDDPFVLTIIGLFLVAICLLGTLLLAQIVHARNAVRER